jgi:Transposase DDE domain
LDLLEPTGVRSAPQALKVRELHTSGKILMTTLLCPKQTSKAALKALYRDRWHVVLDLRNIKTTRGMERLSCRTPAMAEKENWVYLLAYNPIRLLMAQAALSADILPRQLSFKQTLRLWIAWRQNGTGSVDEHQLTMLFILIAQLSPRRRMRS